MTAALPVVAGYEDLVEVGRGGFAVVYRAHQIAVGGDVALKVLTRPDVGPEDQRRFEHECHSMGRLRNHPHVVTVFDAGATAEGYPYLSMEYLSGGSLGGVVRREGPLPADRVARYGVQLADALAAAHAEGVLHRDVKPDNALLDGRGEVQLADFGIARVVGGTQTATDSITATVAHAAPEVFEAGRTSEASDVYSLGSTLFELLVGRSAFVVDGDHLVLPLMRRIAEEPVPDLGAHGVPPALTAVINAAMAKDAADRPASAEDFGATLAEVSRDLTPPTATGGSDGGSGAGPAEGMGDEADVATERVDVGRAGAPPRDGSSATRRLPDEDPAGRAGGPDDHGRTTARRRRWGPIVTAIVVVAALGLAALWRWLAAPDEESASESIEVARTIEVAAQPVAIALTGTCDPDAQADEPVDTGAGVGTTPRGRCDDLWVTSAGEEVVQRIDQETGEVQATLPIDQPGAVASSSGSIWVAGGDGVVSELDADSSRIAEQIETDASLSALVHQDLGVDGEGTARERIWAADQDGDELVRVNPDTREVSDRVGVGGRPLAVDTLGPIDEVWVANAEDGTVSRVDPTGSMPMETVPVGDEPVALRASRDGIWVVNRGDDTVMRVDPEAMTVTDTIEVGDEPTAVSVSERAVWVVNAGDDTAMRIEPETGRVSATVPVGPRPVDVIADRTGVWVLSAGDATVSRIPG